MWKKSLVVMNRTEDYLLNLHHMLHAEFHLNNSHMTREHNCIFGREVTPSHKNANTWWLSAPRVSSGNLFWRHENGSCLSEVRNQPYSRPHLSSCKLNDKNSIILLKQFFRSGVWHRVPLICSKWAAGSVMPCISETQRGSTWPHCEDVFTLDDEWKMAKFWILCTDNSVIFRLQQATYSLPKQLTNTDRYPKDPDMQLVETKDRANRKRIGQLQLFVITT